METTGSTVLSPTSTYKLQKVLGSGTFGTVYEALRSDGSLFAVKVTSLLEGALSEVEILQSISHRYIVKYEEHWCVEKKLYIVTELCLHGTLADMISALCMQDALEFAMQLSLGLAYVHSKGVIHRDLKPGNIFYLVRSLKLGDFGLAKQTGDSVNAETFAGTLLYMNPQILEGSRYTAKGDVWSLGCIFYEMVMKKTPYTIWQNGFVETLQNMKAQVFPPMPDCCPPRFTGLVSAMLQFEECDRPTMDDVVTEMRIICQDMSMSRTPSPSSPKENTEEHKVTSPSPRPQFVENIVTVDHLTVPKRPFARTLEPLVGRKLPAEGGDAVLRREPYLSLSRADPTPQHPTCSPQTTPTPTPRPISASPTPTPGPQTSPASPTLTTLSPQAHSLPVAAMRTHSLSPPIQAHSVPGSRVHENSRYSPKRLLARRLEPIKRSTFTSNASETCERGSEGRSDISMIIPLPDSRKSKPLSEVVTSPADVNSVGDQKGFSEEGEGELPGTPESGSTCADTKQSSFVLADGLENNVERDLRRDFTRPAPGGKSSRRSTAKSRSASELPFQCAPGSAEDPMSSSTRVGGPSFQPETDRRMSARSSSDSDETHDRTHSKLHNGEQPTTTFSASFSGAVFSYLLPVVVGLSLTGVAFSEVVRQGLSDGTSYGLSFYLHVAALLMLCVGRTLPRSNAYI
eukprot:Rmarinus@m.17766